MKNIDRLDLVGTATLSAFSLIVTGSIGLIPLVGWIFATIIQLALGYGLGWVELPIPSRFVVGIMSLFGLFLSVVLKSNHALARFWFMVLPAAGLFLWGYMSGSRKATKEESDEAAM